MRNSFRRNQFTAALGYLTRGNGVGLGQNQYEFLTAEAREEIARSSRSTAEHAGHTLQAGIAIDVAVVVVVLFEVVDIEQDQRQRCSPTSRTRPFNFQRGIEATTVGDAREPVLERKLFEFLLQCQQFLF